MSVSRVAVTAILIILMVGCIHPIGIVGEGDVYSATGTRNCYYEDFLVGADSCSKNLVVYDYNETYFAVPRRGWEFESWSNYSHCADSGNACAFNIPADLVKIFGWGQTVPTLVAVFTEIAPPPPKPVAMYSYELDAAGALLNPLLLEGANLQRKTVYFSFTGEYSALTFWCCKVVGGTESPMPPVTDDSAPFVLRVDLGALPADNGLARELLAHLFDASGEYQVQLAHWTLEPPPTSPLIFGDGGTHVIDYTVPNRVVIENSTTVNVLEGAKLLSGASVLFSESERDSTLNVFGGEIFSEILNQASQVNLYGGTSARITHVGDAKSTVLGGAVGTIGSEFGGTILIEGGSVAGIGVNNVSLTISGGVIGRTFIEASTLKITGGTFNSEIKFNHLDCEITGGEFFGPWFGGSVGDGMCAIKGGQFSGGFTYYGSNSEPIFTFYGHLEESVPELIVANQYESVISGTLADGSVLSQKITCFLDYSESCDGIVIISD